MSIYTPETVREHVRSTYTSDTSEANDASEATRCECCDGVIENEDNAIEHNGSIMHEDCFNECHAVCDHCGSIHGSDDMTYIESSRSMVCQSCLEDYFITCDDCGELHDRDDMTYIEHEDSIVCSDCLERFYTTCDHCGSIHAEGNMAYIENENTVCQTCLHDYCFECYECGGTFFLDDGYTHDDGETRCESCHDAVVSSESEHINGYCYKPAPIFFGDTCDNTHPYLGVELEVENHSGYDYHHREAARVISEGRWSERLYLKEDGSLDEGFEIVTHPLTLDEHLSSGMWQDVTDVCRAHDMLSHDTTTCGLHVHVNRDFFGKSSFVQKVGGYNLGILISRFESQMIKLARRNSTQWSEYGLHNEVLDKDGEASSLGLREKADRITSSYGRYKCVNYNNTNTFEIRIFRGTLKVETLYATFALVEGLCQIAKNRSSVWCETANWDEVVSQMMIHLPPDAKDELISYMSERGLPVNTGGIDSRDKKGKATRFNTSSEDNIQFGWSRYKEHYPLVASAFIHAEEILARLAEANISTANAAATNYEDIPEDVRSTVTPTVWARLQNTLGTLGTQSARGIVAVARLMELKKDAARALVEDSVLTVDIYRPVNLDREERELIQLLSGFKLNDDSAVYLLHAMSHIIDETCSVIRNNAPEWRAAACSVHAGVWY